MTHSLTALVLTPSLGGDFFGDVLAGLAREIVAAGGRLVVVETLRESAPRDEAGEPGSFATPVAWSQVDGVISLTTAAGAPYLHRLRAAGKPVVLLSSTQTGDFQAPVTRPDNHRGTVAAVDHLIEHGHKHIGFVGNLAQRDIRQRFDAYQETLESHGLVADPSLMFATPENGETGGAVAARALLDAPDRPTAVMVGTDRNAIGLTRALTEAGLTIPRDLAIVAFDNIAAGAFATPTLSTVDPRFDEVGALAARLLVAGIRGEAAPNTTVTPESAALTLRESCGCEAETPHDPYEDDSKGRRAPSALLRERLQYALDRELRTGDEAVDSQYRDAATATVRDAVDLLELGDQATPAQIHALATSLRDLTSRPDTVRRFTDAMIEYTQQAGPQIGSTADGASAVPALLAAALWKAQASAFLHHAEITNAAVVEQFTVDAGLVATSGSDPRDLHWLTGTSVKAGALALWDDGPASGLLTIVGEYGDAGAPLDLVGTNLPTEEFPPKALISMASGSDREVCLVVPVSTPEQDWGLLAVIVTIDPTTERETYQHWAALLCAALESQRRQEEIRRSALFDSLTGLPNRLLFVQQLEQALARWRRTEVPFSVLFLDLDDFKLINDSLGHQMGDRVLKTVAAEISRELRAMDMAARFGGDEFVILLADTEPSSAMAAARRVQKALSQVRLFDGHEIATRASIGVASSAVEYTSAEEVLRDADAAMYRAKAAEPGTVAFFDAPMHASAQRRAELAREVLHGLQVNQFEVHYQPIVNLDTGRTDRFEALVRWRHPERGLIEPTEFLSDIEETSLIVQLGHWVLDEVCQRLAEWGPQVTNVSINISDKEFWSQDLLTHVLTTLRRHELPPEMLTIEITEGVLMRRPEMALRIMDKLHEAGLRLHIDDFGTGYSSLETLHRFPVEAFKIDRSFIQSLTAGGNSAELISSLVQLGKALGLAVLAEGVETEEQLVFLQSLGCATGQGFLFMPAVAGDRVADLLGRDLHDKGAGLSP
ncbi:EAL domain-containing protein [Demequina sp.]|uniref:EAL domain-containing protein n=1 Tax=Demequina sp. TaxID=2050685 RepID=UPI0025BA2827|nr:EAL domain-containing protein [Demequina sp.]